MKRRRKKKREKKKQEKNEGKADQKINNVVMVTGQPDLVAASLRDKVLVW